MAERYRIVDTAGSERGIVEDERPEIAEGDEVVVDGVATEVVEVYDDADGREGGVRATVVVDLD